MKKIGLVGIVAGALSVAVIGSAGPAQAAGTGHGIAGHRHHSVYSSWYGNNDSNNPWLYALFPSVKVPHVDTSVPS